MEGAGCRKTTFWEMYRDWEVICHPMFKAQGKILPFSKQMADAAQVLKYGKPLSEMKH